MTGSTMISSIRGLDREQIWDFENGYHWFSEPRRYFKVLAQYELYKRIVELPGEIAEFGVFKGASLIRFATFRRLMETDCSRSIYGFDMFGEFPSDGLNKDSDLDFIDRFSAVAGNGLDVEELDAVMQAKGFENYDLIKGNVMETIDPFLEEHSYIRFAALHFDLDVEEPTTYLLERLYDRVVPGGLVIFDNYATVAGESDAVDAFLRDKGARLQKLPFANIPTFFEKA